jgi:hypothetical protein
LGGGSGGSRYPPTPTTGLVPGSIAIPAKSRQAESVTKESLTESPAAFLVPYRNKPTSSINGGRKQEI